MKAGVAYQRNADDTVGVIRSAEADVSYINCGEKKDFLVLDRGAHSSAVVHTNRELLF